MWFQEKIAKEIADRLAKEASEEEEKRKKGAAIAPPTFVDEVNEAEVEEPQIIEQPTKRQKFSKNVSGLGVAANIMVPFVCEA